MALLVGRAASADPIVYAVDRTFAMHESVANGEFVTCVDGAGTRLELPAGSACPALTLRGTITTDGTLGAWEIAEHLVAAALTLSDGTHSAQLDATEGWLFAEGGLLLGIAAIGPANTRLHDPVSGAEWIASGLERGSVYELASGFGLGIHRLLPEWTPERPYAPLGVAVPEPSTALLLGLGSSMLRKVRRSPTRDARPAPRTEW